MNVPIPPAENVPVNQLRVDGDNPNRMTERQHMALRQSIERYGFIVPIITNKDLLIADGEQRWVVAKAMGMPEVSVIRLPVEDVDRRLLRQVLNKLRGEHELVADAYEFQRIIEAGHEDDLKQLIDLSDSQIERYLAEIREPHEETYDIPDIEKVQTDIKHGDIHQLGKHRLMCGDATKPNNIQELMNGISAEVGLHDPPYGIDLMKGRSGHLGKSSRMYVPLINDEARIDVRFLLTTADNTILFGGNYFASQLPPSSGWIVWDKQHGKTVTFGDAELLYSTFQKPIRLITHIWDGWRKDSEKGETRIHPTQKPVKLLADILVRYVSRQGIVQDLFGGTGSTLIACEQTGRRCYMMEIDPRYCQVIINRWQAYTGQHAEKIG